MQQLFWSCCEGLASMLRKTEDTQLLFDLGAEARTPAAHREGEKIW